MHLQGRSASGAPGRQAGLHPAAARPGTGKRPSAGLELPSIEHRPATDRVDCVVPKNIADSMRSVDKAGSPLRTEPPGITRIRP